MVISKAYSSQVVMIHFQPSQAAGSVTDEFLEEKKLKKCARWDAAGPRKKVGAEMRSVLVGNDFNGWIDQPVHL